MSDAKPGIRTTEFWLTLSKGVVGPVLAILVATGSLSSEQQNEWLRLTEEIVKGAVAVAALVMSGTAVETYTKERTKAKGADSGP